MIRTFTGDYLKFKHGTSGKKQYFALLKNKGYSRISRRYFSRATDALAWSERWAARVNARTQGKTAVIDTADNHPGRNRLFITFEDYGE